MAAYMLIHFDVDYDEWKPVFDTDPAGRAQAATGYTISRGVDNPNDVFVRADFESVEKARAFREKLMGTGAPSRFTMKMPPTVVEVVETRTY